ncbi:uncharacterized protein LOC128157614 isoform X2 [Crassostrea angulata]|uniref:uncharacterized protein LOC128157614 isoform X2 n=1 Tax=Magallana angulata TaxID=2784310 RepID=UPI0022B12694|nr:uncharacterized protein LOC128157614 isoform X2 [Crassostrea angulata]
MESTILILVMIFWKHSAGEFYDPYLKILDDCNERYIATTRNKENRYLPNSNEAWTVLVSETQCSSGLSIRINQLSIYTTNDSCTDYLKIEEIGSSRVLFHSCDGKQNYIETAGNGVRISFISDDMHEGSGFQLSVKKNCSRNIPICSSNLSSLKPFNERESKSTKESHEHLSAGVLSTQYLTSFNERESKSRKESQERLSPGVLSTQYLTATVISSIHQSTVDVPFKENTYLTVVILTTFLAGIICTSVFVAIVILIRNNRNKKNKAANPSIRMPRTSLYAAIENLNERKGSETNNCITQFAETAVIEERCIYAVPGNKNDVTNTGRFQISECEAEKVQVSLAVNEKCLDTNHSGFLQQDDNEVNPYRDNPNYDILYRPRSPLYEKQCNIYNTHL